VLTNLNPSQNARPLNEQLDFLPRSTGVYILKGEGALPLYIGKSVNIRSRVLAHLRAEDEVRMMARCRNVEVIETAGEIGALLLESRLIKQQSPLFNIRLRRNRQLCSICLTPKPGGVTPEIVSGPDVAFGQTPGLFGLFASTHAAQRKLRKLADTHHLCMGLLGLEKTSPRGCFGLQVRSCKGACVGRESRQAHDGRLTMALEALKVHVWPFAGAVDLVEQSADWVQRHRLENWAYLGTMCSRNGTLEMSSTNDFDLDTYKILVRPVIQEMAVIEPIANYK
jgi:excinuclease Cho